MSIKSTFCAAGLSALALGLPTAAVAQDVELVFWSWLPGLEEQIGMFEEANPGITVQLVNVGQENDHFPKFRNAIRAGDGAPDVIHMLYHTQPSFVISNALLDIAPYGAGELGDQYVEWIWNQVSPDGEAVYGMPWDSGPFGVVYRRDKFEEAGIGEIGTWDEFRDAAVKFQETFPEGYITSAAFSFGPWADALFWQAGSRPFEMIDDTTIRIAINNPEAKMAAEYWTGLIRDDLVDIQPIFTSEWYSALDSGATASWITAAWGPVFLAGFANESMGNWGAAPMPQWEEGQSVSSNWGGSTIAVASTTEHPEEAAKLAIFLSNDRKAAQAFMDNQFLFPVLLDKLNSEEFLNATSEFYGDEPQNQVFVESASMIEPDFEWSPFQRVVYAEMGNYLGEAATNKDSLADALDRVQEVIVEYATDQGFTVVE